MLIVLFCQSDGLLPADAMTGHNLERENPPRPLLCNVSQPWIPCYKYSISHIPVYVKQSSNQYIH